MKKMTWLLALLLALVLLVGCATTQPPNETTSPTLPSPTRGETNATGPFDILVRGGNGFDFSFILRNNSDETFFYSDAYRLYVYADSWQFHHQHTGSGAEYYLRPGAVRNISVPWGGRGVSMQIEPGNYRLVMESIEIEFEQLHWVDGEGSRVDTSDQDWLGFVLAGQPASGAQVSNVAATPVGMTFTLENRSDSGFFYGVSYTLARYENGQWLTLPFIIDDAIWISIGFTLPSGETQDYEIEWAWLYGELAPGRYMFIRDMSLTVKPFVYEVDGVERWSNIHHRYPTVVYLMVEFEL